MKVLVVVDMQNDFIDGSLGTAEAETVVPAVMERIRSFEGRVIATRDTHSEDYLNTEEGRHLPVIHCVKGTEGWKIRREIDALLDEKAAVRIDKPTFGSVELGSYVKELDDEAGGEEITLIGVCTAEIRVDGSCCAGGTPESHERALEAMKSCQIDIV